MKMLIVSLFLNIIFILIFIFRYVRSEKYTIILDDGTIDKKRVIYKIVADLKEMNNLMIVLYKTYVIDDVLNMYIRIVNHYKNFSEDEIDIDNIRIIKVIED